MSIADAGIVEQIQELGQHRVPEILTQCRHRTGLDFAFNSTHHHDISVFVMEVTSYREICSKSYVVSASPIKIHLPHLTQIRDKIHTISHPTPSYSLIFTSYAVYIHDTWYKSPSVIYVEQCLFDVVQFKLISYLLKQLRSTPTNSFIARHIRFPAECR